jgi:HEAT repeat protein
VVEIPNAAAMGIAQKMQAAIEVAAQMKLSEVEEQVMKALGNKKLPETARSAAAAGLGAMNGIKHVGLLSSVLNDASEPNGLREKAAEALGATDSREARAALITGLAGAPDKLQTKIAQALCSRAESCEALLKTIGDGKASPARAAGSRRQGSADSTEAGGLG